jgi:hypothetical protein
MSPIEFFRKYAIRQNEPWLRQYWSRALNDDNNKIIPQFHLTWNCPNGCEYCAFNCGPWASTEIIPVADIKHFSDMFRTLPNFSRHIGISGGEPTTTPIEYQSEIYQHILGTDTDNHCNLTILTNGGWINDPTQRHQIVEMLRGLKNIHIYRIGVVDSKKLHDTSLCLELATDGTDKKSLQNYVGFMHDLYQDPELFQKVSFTLGTMHRNKSQFWDSLDSMRDEFDIKIINDNFISVAGRIIKIDPRSGYWDNTGNPKSKIREQLKRPDLMRNFLIPDENSGSNKLAVYFYPNEIASLRVENTIIAKTSYKKPDGKYKDWDELKSGFTDGLYDDMIHYPENRAARYSEYLSARRFRRGQSTHHIHKSW